MRTAPYSLSRALWGAISIAIALVSLLLIAALLAIHLQRVDDQFSDYSKRASAYLKKTLEPALWALDMNIAHAIMEGFAANPRVAVLELRSDSGSVLYHYDKGVAVFSETEFPVSRDGKVLGTVRIALDATVRRTATMDVFVAAMVTAVVAILVQGLVVTYVLRALLKRPLEQLGNVVDSYNAGDFSYQSKEPMYEEFKPLVGAMREMGARLEEHVEKIKESEAKYRSFFKNSPMGVFRSTISGRLVEANPALVDMFRAGSEAEMLEWGKNLEVAYVRGGEMAEYAEKLLVSPAGFGFETTLIRVDGSRFFARATIAVSAQREGDDLCVEGMIEDVTERLQAMYRVRQSEEKFSRLFKHAPFPISLSTFPERRFVDVNDAYLQLSGYAYDDIIGKTSAELGLINDPASAAKVSELCAKYGGASDVRCEMRTKGGDVRELSITAQVIEFGSEKFVIIIFRDVTGELKVQEMMIQSEKMISISGIAAGVAHEINNPLGIIVQAAQMTELRLDPIMERNLRVAEELGVNLSDVHAYADKRGILEFVGQIRAASLRASSIIRNMLDFSRTSSKNRALCTVASLIDKSLELASRDYELRKSYDFRKIAIAREFEGGLPSIVCVETEIEQVLINLFRNAAQAIAMADPPVEHPRIEIVSRHEDGLVVIEVADNGPGMPSEVRRRVFEPFFTTKPVGQGTGLGLPVSYFIITSGHGGQMEVFSKPGHGARFVIKLPVGTLPSSGVIGDY